MVNFARVSLFSLIVVATCLIASCAVSGGVASEKQDVGKRKIAIKTNDTTNRTTIYKDSSGLKFCYPAGWTVKHKPEKDTIIKVKGDVRPGVEGEIAVGVVDNPTGISAPALESLLHKLMFSKIDGVKKSKLEKRFVGKTGRIPCYSERIRFTMKSMPVHQDLVLIPAKGKIFSFILTTSQWQRDQLEEVWQRCLMSIEAPQSLIALAPPSQAMAQKRVAYCNSYSTQCARVRKPVKGMTLEQKVRAVLPRKKEERFLDIPWQTDIMAARRLSRQVGKPLFLWIMDGNVLGAT